MPKEKIKIKEDETEAEECVKEAEDEDEEKPGEGLRYKEDEARKKKKKKGLDAEAEDEEVDEDMTEKAGLEQSPAESAAASTTAGNTLTPGKMTGKPQNVFVPQSNIIGTRIGSGTTPGQESYSSKSVEPDLLKSPLFVELSGQIESMQKSVASKLEAVEKSVNDRLVNISKAVEKFYSQPLYKAVNENVSPEASLRKSISEQISDGKIRFTE